MSNRLIKSALKAIETNGRPFRPSQELRAYLVDNGVAVSSATQITLGPKARQTLVDILERDFGVPPGTRLSGLDGLSRTEALAITTDEKITRQAVRSSRVAVKALAGRALRVGENALPLPEGVNLDVAAEDAALFQAYDLILLIENWEAFERIHLLSYELDEELKGALVLYRGQPHGYSIDAARDFSARLDKPVHVLPDPDPAGLHLAMSYPGFAGLALPPPEQVRDIILSGRGVAERYLSQLPKVERVLDACEEPQIRAYWEVFKETGRALPQEEFVRGDQIKS